METRITIENLTQDGVNIKKQRIIIDNEQELNVGEPFRVSYINSSSQKQQMIEEVEEPFCSAILAVWGESPTIEETTIEEEEIL